MKNLYLAIRRALFLSMALSSLLVIVLTGCGSSQTSKGNGSEGNISKVSFVHESHLTNMRKFSYREDLDSLSSAIGGNKIVDVKVLKSNNGITTARLTKDELIIEFDKGILDENYPIYQYGAELELSYVGEPFAEFNTITVGGHDILLVDYYNGEVYENYLLPTEYEGKSEDEVKKGVIGNALKFQEEAFSDPTIVEMISKAVPSGVSNQKDIALLAHRFIKQNFEYDGDYMDLLQSGSPTKKINSIVDMLESRKGVCYQMALFYKAILDAHNIENQLVYGYLSDLPGLPNDDPNEATHVWNQVYIDGEWISVDNTSDGENFGARFSNHVGVYSSNI